MKSPLAFLSILAVTTATLFGASGAQALELPPVKRCLAPTMKIVKKGNRKFKPDSWFVQRLHRRGCLDRARPKAFKPFSNQCKAKSQSADSYLTTLQKNFILRLDELLLQNQPRLLRLDEQEISLLNQRKSVNRQIRNSSGSRRASLVRKRNGIDNQLVTIRTKRARINYRMNTQAITRSGATGVWLAYFDGVAHGCLKAFRGSPYLMVMREHFLVQLAAAQRVSPEPTRANIQTWTNLLSGRALSPAGGR
jgi:hypothetical protein